MGYALGLEAEHDDAQDLAVTWGEVFIVRASKTVTTTEGLTPHRNFVTIILGIPVQIRLGASDSLLSNIHIHFHHLTPKVEPHITAWHNM
jgi:hypothetical protein